MSGFVKLSLILCWVIVWEERLWNELFFCVEWAMKPWLSANPLVKAVCVVFYKLVLLWMWDVLLVLRCSRSVTVMLSSCCYWLNSSLLCHVLRGVTLTHSAVLFCFVVDWRVLTVLCFYWLFWTYRLNVYNIYLPTSRLIGAFVGVVFDIAVLWMNGSPWSVDDGIGAAVSLENW